MLTVIAYYIFTSALELSNKKIKGSQNTMKKSSIINDIQGKIYKNQYYYQVLSRKLACHCSKKITMLVNDSDAICGPVNAENSAHPVLAAFVELMDDSSTRFAILGLSAIVQTITLECPTALVSVFT